MKYVFVFLCTVQLIGFAKAQKAIAANVDSFKANGNDTLDDTKAIQACINYVASKGGGTVLFPKGTYYISNQKIPGKAICLLAKSNVIMLGENRDQCILKLANNQPGFSTILNVADAANIKIKNLTFDGNYKNQHVDNNEHSHGILIDQSDSVNIKNCALINTCGDGAGIRGVQKNSSNINIQDCFFNGNQRDGVVLGSGFKNITIKNCFFGKDIQHDAIHTEPENGNFFGNVLIKNNNIETPHNLTVAGSGPGAPATNFVIANNTLKGCSVYIVYASQITIQNNHIENSLDRSAITIFKNCSNIFISSNQITVNHNAAFTITYSANLFSKNIIIDSNLIYFNVADVPCFQIKGCDSIKISHNKIITNGNAKTMLEANATRSITNLDFSNNEVGYFEKNFSFKSVQNNTINNFSARNNIFSNKSVSIDETMKPKMQNTILQNNH